MRDSAPNAKCAITELSERALQFPPLLAIIPSMVYTSAEGTFSNCRHRRQNLVASQCSGNFVDRYLVVVLNSNIRNRDGMG